MLPHPGQLFLELPHPRSLAPQLGLSDHRNLLLDLGRLLDACSVCSSLLGPKPCQGRCRVS
jgi:hypothetical protein